MKRIPLIAVLVLLTAAAVMAAGAEDKLKGYTWKSQVQVSLEGEVRSTKIYQVTKLPDGTQQKTELSSDDSGGTRGPLRRRIAERIEDREADWIEGLKTQLEAYGKVTPAQMEAFMKTAKVEEIPNTNPPQVRVTGKGLVSPQDQVTLVAALQGDAKIPVSMDVQTAYDAQPVTLDLAFGLLDGGIPYAQKTQIGVASKKLLVVITNSDYKKP